MLILFIGAVTGYFAGKMGVNAAKEVSKATVFVVAALFIPLFFIVIGIHEAGHAWAGIKVNFDFRMYVIGPFMWEKEQNKWKFKWNKNINTAGGLVLCVPVGTDNLSKRFSIYAAGGPMASMLLAVFAYGLSRLISITNRSVDSGMETVSFILLTVAFLSSVIFVATSIPMQNGGFSSDGARILSLLRGGKKARFETLILKIIADSMSGIRPKLLNMKELTEAQEIAAEINPPFGVYVHSFFHQAAFDRADLGDAEKHLIEYVRKADAIPEGIRNAVWMDATFFYAFGKRDIEEAQKYWDQFKLSAMISKAQIYATEAAMASLKKDDETVIAKIDAAMKELPAMLDKGVGIALKEKLQLLQIRTKTRA
ncbi:M50 family metallopeptidase [Dyadobacter sp. 3J3]|uniref:M50 family metallopeptidase n=1 Tax=Dyadobacter sp. 3J3 TaxID=2606600 RepID=UPI00135C9CDC|nr:M50 family metallopeptidase [Dyadobacter sp. 3J3]